MVLGKFLGEVLPRRLATTSCPKDFTATRLTAGLSLRHFINLQVYREQPQLVNQSSDIFS